MIVTEQHIKTALRTVQKERNQQFNYPKQTVNELLDAIHNRTAHRLKGRVLDIINCMLFEEERSENFKKSA